MAAYKRHGKSGYRGRETGADTLAFLLKGLETQLTTFTCSDSASQAEVQLSDVKSVASYSWIDEPVLTIAVPGSPRIWAEERSPVVNVPQDNGVQFMHHDATKMGDRSPLLPLFAAIDALHTDFPYQDLDLITDRNSLRKLMRFVNNVKSKGIFRVDVDLVHNTCFFTRREEKPEIRGNWSGYGHEYLRAATKTPPGIQKMLDHHRAITYKFGGLNVLLSCTVDACTGTDADDNDRLLSSFSSLSIGGSATKPNAQSFAGINIRLTSPSSLVPQSSLIEIKTRSARSGLDWKEIFPQIYLAQTGSLYVAKHTAGTFEPVEKIPLDGERMNMQAQKMEASLAKLKALLVDILRAVREQGEGVPLTLVCQGPGKLSLWRRKKGSGKPLGVEITSKFGV